jgi:hypothetical protein
MSKQHTDSFNHTNGGYEEASSVRQNIVLIGSRPARTNHNHARPMKSCLRDKRSLSECGPDGFTAAKGDALQFIAKGGRSKGLDQRSPI